MQAVRRSRTRQIVSFTELEQEVVDLAGQPPYRTYRQIAEELTRRHPDKPVTEDAVKQRMSTALGRFYSCNGYCNLWKNFRQRRRRIRRGLIKKKDAEGELINT